MEPDFSDPLRWGVWLFMLIGVVALAGAAYWFNRRLAILLKPGRAEGAVVDAEDSSSEPGQRTFRPVVEFRTPDGKTHRVVGRTGTKAGGDFIGRKVNVAYDPANPRRAFLLTFVQGWLVPVCLTILGTAFLGLGLLTGQALDFPEDLESKAKLHEMQAKLQEAQKQMGIKGEENTESAKLSRQGLDLPQDLIKNFKR